jgi:phosphoribosyl-AMP cyclohydrolase / phosphoribosyl-ATP pyrophosphohydrolase
MNPVDIDALDWAKGDGLLPAVIQDADYGEVLMLGYMNRDALAATLDTGRVTFWSRSRSQLWVKGETSGNTIEVHGVTADCDRDTLLVLGRPAGPVCHTGAPTCFHGQTPSAATELGFLLHLEKIIESRIADHPESSYTARLHASGLTRMAQKVGEEGLEVALGAVTAGDGELVGEAADLVFHLLLLLRARGLALGDVVKELVDRHAARS